MNIENDYENLQTPAPAYGAQLDNRGTADQLPGGGDTSDAAAVSTPAQKVKKSITPVNGEVNLLSSFKWVPAIDGKKEIEYLEKGKWQASTEDFKAVIGDVTNAIIPQNFHAFLGLIAAYAPASIGRLNFFTHADATTIGITGVLDETGVYYSTTISGQTLINHADNNYRYDFMGNKFDLQDVRDRFKSDAFMVIYGCETAFDPKELLQGLKKLLNIAVIGFREATVFCPPIQNAGATIFNRKGEKIGINKVGFSCAADSTRDWRGLINHPKAVRLNK
ncbi:MAG: hypothetical protein JNK79_07565 [Chitinophagaceae bacterium]|nr:hypothetical protein [Chitinophagaceae bacterium]